MTHVSCEVDTKTGLVVDTITGKPVPARGGGKPTSTPEEGLSTYSGSTAKEICVAFFESENCPITQYSHAAYIGRELVHAEEALRYGTRYVQD
mmetsp:Transcript_31459/g.43662  ORF Transcript_31459/g.43662 Transcript_31459/m.43662 type:complete len:93 (+) Transcript_31459:370-648(+)